MIRAMNGQTDELLLDLQTLQAALTRLHGTLRQHADSLSALHAALLARSRSTPANDA